MLQSDNSYAQAFLILGSVIIVLVWRNSKYVSTYTHYLDNDYLRVDRLLIHELPTLILYNSSPTGKNSILKSKIACPP